MDKIRVMLVDDHQVVRDGLRHMLSLEEDIDVVAEASEAKDALSKAATLSPEVVLMDIKMPEVDGLELTRLLKKSCPSCNIIMLTLYDEYLPQAIEAGAVGYLLKDVKRDELVKAIKAVHEGRAPLGLSLSQDRLSQLTGVAESKQHAILNERELTILQLVANGVTTREVAAQLFLSQASVKRSISVIFEKLGVRNRSEAVSEAYKRKLI